MKRTVFKGIALVAILMFIALGRICLVSPEGMRIAGTALAAEVVMLTLAYLAATALNVRTLVPRLLLRKSFAAYLLSLLGFAMTFTGIEVCFERLLIDCYHLSPGEYWYFADDSILFFELLSAVSAYFISVAGTAIIVFLRLWNRSGRRLDDLEKQNARSELERLRTRIDAEALFDTLDRAADMIRRSPSEVAGMLMTLSKRLRVQLYESEHGQGAASRGEVSTPVFDLSSPALDFLTERRFRTVRHLAMIACFMLIVSANFNGTWSSFFNMSLFLSLYLTMIYFNLYVLTPKLMMRNRMGAYLASVGLTSIVFVAPSLAFNYLETGINGHHSIFMLTICMVNNVVKLCFPMISVSVVKLFQRWVRNERHIAELEAITLRSELEQLQTQVNPHFLFNMLNNIIVLTRKNPAEAAGVIRKLSDMLKYQFRGYERQSIRLGDDVRFLSDYLNLEKLRRDNFEFSIATEGGVEELSLPPLLFIPFVENAVKHNNDNRNLSFVRLRFGLEDGALHFGCVNSKPLRPMRKDEAGGLGLPNVRRRLDLLYGESYSLEISENDTSYSVQLRIEFKTIKI
jgi:sensor histidine kinase YesM